ncbi:MAG: iron-sulfur cluster assembly accessory protein [Deltaproteobacteria bacterium]|nr:MAG: iron-sulfur cluster assembly accessory protein [Deltaproteobacteria bacterium]
MIEVTQRAAHKALLIAKNESRSPIILRLGVRGGGCSGLSYFFEFVTAPRDHDLRWEAHGLQVVCDPKSHALLADSSFDFEPNLLKGGFRFNNPQAKRSCSCGESFAL